METPVNRHNAIRRGLGGLTHGHESIDSITIKFDRAARQHHRARLGHSSDLVPPGAAQLANANDAARTFAPALIEVLP